MNPDVALISILFAWITGFVMGLLAADLAIRRAKK